MKQFYTIITALMLALPTLAQAVEGIVISSDGQAVRGAVLSSPGQTTVVTGEDGTFRMDLQKDAVLSVWADGYYYQQIRYKGQSSLKVVLSRQDAHKYTESKVLPFRVEQNVNLSEVNTLSKKDFALGARSVEQALQGELAGLQLINKSGMMGEGAFLSHHGIQTLAANASPLVVINGVPFMPSMDESQLIGGFSKSIFQAYNIYDIQDISFLSGAEASVYGSLGANGVLLIETDGASSDDMDTKISYHGKFGYSWNDRRLPMMKSSQYKSYLSDIGMTYYNNMETFFANFPFLSPDESDAYNYLYRFDTDWQNELFRRGVTTDHLVRVEGGDAIAKYDISLGYQHDEGALKSTQSDRFNAQINSNVIVTKKFEIGTSIGLAFLNGSYQEQGLIMETNPLLAAYRRAPVLSPYKNDMAGNLLETYASYYYGNNTNTDFIVSNPLAIVNTLAADKRQYDININARVLYKPTNQLSFMALLGLYYNYDQEGIFVPGINNKDVVPQFDTYGESKNIVRQGVNETFNSFYHLNAAYNNVFNDVHGVDLRLGGQIISNSFETDMGVGRNTANDFYQTLADVQRVGRFFSGYGAKWSWLNAYLQAAYTYSDLFRVAANVSTDGASSTGVNTTRMGVFPSASATVMLANFDFIKSAEAVNRLNLYADYGKTGNSRFSHTYGSYYYVSRLYQGIAGIVRNNVPNTEIKWEENLKANMGIDMALWRHRVQIKLGYYNNRATDVLMAGSESALYGTGVHYVNDAAIDANGFDLSLNVSPVCTRNFKWILGGNITQLNNKVTSLGNRTHIINKLSDGAAIITKVGESPYSFYGYRTDGDYPVYSTVKEAQSAYKYTENGVECSRPMRNRNGVEFQAGDIKYVDQNNDGIINDLDRVLLGSATPDFYGGLFNRFQYKGFAIDLNFVYSLGNEAYNAVRRITESSLDMSNQSLAVLRRWTVDGQITDMPRANYYDLVGNNDFSDRWIEDASYLKLRDITFSYTFDNILLGFIQGGTLYVSGQNLWCLTHYLGNDPEFSYSYSAMMQGVDYAKLAAPKTVTFGVNLKF
jgi:TonB-linked SusC/RagA family outer membrane protein